MASHRAQRFRTKHNKEGIGKAGKGDAKKLEKLSVMESCLDSSLGSH